MVAFAGSSQRGTLLNFGIIQNEDEGIIRTIVGFDVGGANNGSVNNNHVITNNGTFANAGRFVNGQITPGAYDNNGFLDNSGVVDNFAVGAGTPGAGAGGVIHNNVGGVIANRAGAVFNNDGVTYNHGTFYRAPGDAWNGNPLALGETTPGNPGDPVPTVPTEPTEPTTPTQPSSSSSSGCNAFAMGALFLIPALAMVRRKK